MAGRIVVSTLNDDTGVLAAQNGMSGIAKAWVNFNGTGTVAIRNSFNVSSITDNGTGDYTVNFTNALPDANYSVTIGTNLVSGATNCGFFGFYNSATSSVRLVTANGAGSIADPFQVAVAIFR
jgi:hypothetical protein